MRADSEGSQRVGPVDGGKGVPALASEGEDGGVFEPGVVLEEVLRTNQAAYESLADYYDSTGAARARRAAWLAPLFAGVDTYDPPITLLDVGAADGHLSAALSRQGYRVTALDFAVGMAGKIRQNAPEIEVICDEFISHPFHAERFDIVVLVAFVHLFPSPWDRIVLEKAASLLTARGVLFVSTTLEAGSAGYQPKNVLGVGPLRYRNRYTRESFLELISSAGLRIHSVHSAPDPTIPSKMWIDCVCSSQPLVNGEVLDLLQTT